MQKAIVFDTETTGNDTAVDEVIEAAFIELPATPAAFAAVRDPKTLPEYLERFEPSIPIKLGAQATHHISLSELQGQGLLGSDQFSLPADVDYLIGHKIDFDWEMAKKPDTKRICTLALSRWLFPEADSHTLSAMMYMIGREYGREAWARDILRDAHSALADVHNCALLLRYQILVIEAKSPGSTESWEQLWSLSEHARIPTVMTFGKHQGERIEDVPYSYVKWYRGTEDQDPYLLEAFKRAGK